MLRFPEQAQPTTPPTTTLRLWAFNTSTPTLRTIDDGGNVGVLTSSLLTTTTADFTGVNNNLAQPVFNTTEDVLTLPATTSYLLQAAYHIHTTGTTSHQLGLLWGGTATFTSIGGWYYATNAATEVLGAVSGIVFTSASVVNVSAALASATHHSVLVHGVVRVNAAGTFIPQYQWSAAPGIAGVTLANSYCRLIPFGSNTTAAVGLWA